MTFLHLFSQKEKSHVRSLTRPGRGSIATSWPTVYSKVNIWREATVQAGTWGLCELLHFPPASHSVSPYPFSPSTCMPPSCMAVGHALLKPRDGQLCCFWFCAAELREMVRLLGLNLKRESASLALLALPAVVWLVWKALKDHRQGRASPGLFSMYILYMNAKHISFIV